MEIERNERKRKKGESEIKEKVSHLLCGWRDLWDLQFSPLVI